MSEGIHTLTREIAVDYVDQQAASLAFLFGMEPDGKDNYDSLEHQLYNLAEDVAMGRADRTDLQDAVMNALGLPEDKRHHARDIFNKAYHLRQKGAYKWTDE